MQDGKNNVARDHQLLEAFGMTHILRPARFAIARAPESLQDLIDHTWDYDPDHANAQDFDVLAIMGDTGKRQVFRINTSTKTVINETTPGVWGGSYFGSLDGQPSGIVADVSGAVVAANFHSSQYSRFNYGTRHRIGAEMYVKATAGSMWGVMRHRRDGLAVDGLGRWESARSSSNLSSGLSIGVGMQLLTAWWDTGGTLRGRDGAGGSRYLGYAQSSSWANGDISYMRAPFEVVNGGKFITYWMGAQGNRTSDASYLGYDYTKLPLKLRA